MKIFTYSEARQKLAKLLDKAKKEGRVLIKRRDGSVFELRPINGKKSPLDVKGVDLGLSSKEISDMLREIRER
ncbi:MAG: type II toxin-antitoxin system Phd/YefM family antitoxin [Bacteroidetes bacterium]|nr:type II toxin-antitoxin system Phd/YefM family antitoxin [Bacteroidota bacterium]